MKTNRITLTVLALLILLFAAGIVRLSLLRFQAGDIYPPLSSLRADPLGIKVLYDALEQQGGLELRRNFRPLTKLQSHSGKAFTLIYAGGNPIDHEWETLWQIARNGNRVVMAALPTTVPPPAPTKDEKKKKPNKEKKEQKVRKTSAAPKPLDFTLEIQKYAEGTTPLARRIGEGDMEETLSWHSLASFKLPEGSPGRILYSVEDRPVIIEFPIGKGSFVVATDAYFLTNEALLKERSPRLLSTLIGNHAIVIFEESHHQIIEQSGVSTLIRQYNLEGCFMVLALIAALYIWKEANPLLPRSTESLEDEGRIEGRNSVEGLVNLLKRSISPSRIVETCVEEWNQSFAHQHGAQKAPATPDDPVKQFAQIANSIPKKIR